jgi:S1-C subfamily serine protease
MNAILSDLSNLLAAAVERAAPAVVQVQGHRRPVAGVVFASDLVAVPARAVDEAVVVRLHDGSTVEGAVLGYALAAGLGVIRVPGLTAAPLATADEPRVGHLAIAVGRTWSGAVMVSVTNVAVVGGPLRTGRASQIERVIRIAQPPHGAFTGGALIDGEGRALGLITGTDIRGTTVVVPAALAWSAGNDVAAHGGTRQGFIGIGSTTVTLPERQRKGRAQDSGLLVTAIVDGSPADQAGLLIGDVLVALDGQDIGDPETLLTLLRGDRVGKPVSLTILRGVKAEDIAVTVGERPRREARR